MNKPRTSLLLMLWGVFCAAVVPGGAAHAQPSSVVNSPHNLSASGPGPVKAVSEQEVCIFCHTPHNASPVRPLWNRAMPTEGYTVYSSPTLEATPGQPSGVSKMCLSCHDGTIALGNVQSRSSPIMLSGGVTTIQGSGLLGTNLADDHPISFRFDRSLTAKNPKLKDPGSLPPQIKLDSTSELQCTSCHDAHNNSLGSFLVMHNDNSELCTSCHQMGTTNITAHANCTACHQSHTAPSGPYLLRQATIDNTCLACHNGSVPTAPNIATDLKKISIHSTNSPVTRTAASHGAAAQSRMSPDQVSCADCHEPHTMMGTQVRAPSALQAGASGSAAASIIPRSLGRVSGMSASGTRVATATAEFEVCFKCHGEGSMHRAWVSRQHQDSNLRQVFSPGAVSFHPVEAAGRNAFVPSLRPGWTVASRMTCTSCHNSDAAKSSGGTGAEGPHGSKNALLLAARYEVKDYTTESAQAYALCYRCHDRANILENRSFSSHSKHIVDLRTPCAACHDAHGISSGTGDRTHNSSLINFATSIVFKDKATGRMEYRSTGMNRGECFLSCHGSNHSPKKYP